VILRVGDRVVYPGQGPCRIDQETRKPVGGQMISFYDLSVLDDRGGHLFVPVEKADTVGLRLLVHRSEIPAILEKLTRIITLSDNWKQRTSDNLRLFNSGSAFDLAEVVKSLTELSDRKTLSAGECKMLARARNLLVQEICEVTGDTGPEVQQEIDKALKSAPESV
jgi:CarD family transcriptional regulator